MSKKHRAGSGPGRSRGTGPNYRRPGGGGGGTGGNTGGTGHRGGSTSSGGAPKVVIWIIAGIYGIPTLAVLAAIGYAVVGRS